MDENKKVNNEELKNKEQKKNYIDEDNKLGCFWAVLLFVFFIGCNNVIFFIIVFGIIGLYWFFYLIIKNFKKIKPIFVFFTKVREFLKPIFAFFAKIHEFLKQKFVILFQFLCKIFDSRILTNILLIIVILKLTYIGHRCGCHCVSSCEIEDAVEKALRSVFYRY